MNTTFLLITTILHLLPHSAGMARIRLRQEHIAEIATAAAAHQGIPVDLLLVVGLHETHMGTDPNEGGGWGAPRDQAHRHLAGTAEDAARILHTGLVRCGSERGAVSWFRDGLCVAHHRSYVDSVMALLARLRTQ